MSCRHTTDEYGLCFECDARMTPAQRAKAAGLKSLQQMADISGVPTRTLRDWYKTKPQLFDIILAGCTARKMGWRV